MVLGYIEGHGGEQLWCYRLSLQAANITNIGRPWASDI